MAMYVERLLMIYMLCVVASGPELQCHAGHACCIYCHPQYASRSQQLPLRHTPIGVPQWSVLTLLSLLDSRLEILYFMCYQLRLRHVFASKETNFSALESQAKKC